MVKVLKFGGSSLADAEQFKKVAAIIKAEPERRYVVASAPGKRFSEDIKVTDMLYDCYKLVKANQPIDDAFKLIEDRYNGIIKDLGINLWLQPEFDRIKNAIVHHAGRDYIASRGEYLNSMVLASYIGYDFIDAEDGIFFRENGTLDEEKTNEELTKILAEHEHAVIPGFYGVMPNGTIKTLQAQLLQEQLRLISTKTGQMFPVCLWLTQDALTTQRLLKQLPMQSFVSFHIWAQPLCTRMQFSLFVKWVFR